MIKSLSIIFPIYNEEKRLSKNLKDIKSFLLEKKVKKEIIFVDDGSHDKTSLMIKNFIKSISKKVKKNNVFLLKSEKNLGKGSALKIGVKKAKLDWVLTADIDMSVPLREIFKWEKKNLLKKNVSVYFGSREHPKSLVKSKFYRKFLGKILRLLINWILNIKIRDTQCGYKLYRKSIAKKIFKKLTINGFEHDLEIVIISKKMLYEIVEVPVRWIHKKHSKLNILVDPLKMFLGLIKIRISK